MSKLINQSDEARKKLLAGVTKLTEIVATSLGPRGRNVIISPRNGLPYVTKDGVTIANEISFSDPIEDAAARIVKQVSSSTNDETGDGTTTATVLAGAIVDAGFDAISNGAQPIEVCRGLQSALTEVIDVIKSKSIEVKSEDLFHVATISANNDEKLGKIISDAFLSIDSDGAVITDDSNTNETTIEVVNGYSIDKGYASQYLSNQDGTTMEFRDCYVLLADAELYNLSEIKSILEEVARSGKPIVFIVNDIVGEALPQLILNKSKGVLRTTAILSPDFGEGRTDVLEDIAALTGATIVGKDNLPTFDKLTMNHLGRASIIKVSERDSTIIAYDERKPFITSHIENIRHKIDTINNEFLIEKYRRRIGKLSGGVAIIKVGASSEVELVEMKHRVQDAVSAVRSALSMGIVPGGGITLVSTAMELEANGNIGHDILLSALCIPFIHILANAGYDGDILKDYTSYYEESPLIGYDANSYKWVNMLEAGIIDPTLVTITAVTKAVSVASTLLTTEAAIAYVPDNVTPTTSITL